MEVGDHCRFLDLPLEIREAIYEEFLDLRVNFIFTDQPARLAEGRRNSLDLEYDYKLRWPREHDEDDLDEPDGDDTEMACPVCYEISPIPCNILVSRHFVSEIRSVYERLRKYTAAIVDGYIYGSSESSKRFKASVDHNDGIFLRLVERGRLILDGSVGNIAHTLVFLPEAVRDRVGSVFITQKCLGREDTDANDDHEQSQSRSWWCKTYSHTEHAPFYIILRRELRNIKHLAIAFDPRDGYYPMWAPIDAFSLLREGKIRTLELALVSDEEVTTPFEDWEALLLLKQIDAQHTFEDRWMLPPMSAANVQRKIRRGWNEKVASEMRYLEKIRDGFTARPLSFPERHGRGLYETPRAMNRYDPEDGCCGSMDENTVYRIDAVVKPDGL